ncbi:MAG: SH3 domain-containing protein [Thermoplasmata archaeon]
MNRVVRVSRRLPASKSIVYPPLRVRPGDHVEVGETSDEWPAFVLVTTKDVKAGWIPSRILRIEGRSGRVLVEYDTTSLDPAVGEELSVISEDVEGGWFWCRDSQGRLGWFPKSHVEMVDV